MPDRRLSTFLVAITLLTIAGTLLAESPEAAFVASVGLICALAAFLLSATRTIAKSDTPQNSLEAIERLRDGALDEPIDLPGDPLSAGLETLRKALLAASEHHQEELVEAEAEIEKLDSKIHEVEHRSKAKADFLAKMSHEIRTPINGIIGLTEILQERCQDTEQRKLLDTVVNSGNALMSLVNDILDLSKIEAGKLELAESPMDTREFLNDLARFYEPLATSKGIEMIATGDHQPHRQRDQVYENGLRESRSESAQSVGRRGHDQIRHSRYGYRN